MGLSRKLGGAVSTRPEPPDHVDYQWSTQAYTMRDILTRFQLPCVVQCAGDAGTVLWAHFRFDMRQPLLLHAARTVRKVHVRSLQIDDVTGKMEEFGPPLAIPEDYDGWFYPVNKQDPTVLPKHTRIEGVAGSSARRFLVTTTLPAFTPSRAPETGPKHVAHEVTAGEVLMKVGVVKGDVSGSGSSSPSALVQRAKQSLRCVDESRHEVIVPFSHRALMYDVAENYHTPSRDAGAAGKASCELLNGPSISGVVSTCTIVNAGNTCLPRVFRHVLGDPPALGESFTGLLRCYSVFTEETVMAATMSRTNLASFSESPSCLELATDSTARFNIALNASDLKKTIQYNAALRTCEEQAPGYVRAIKTSFTVQPEVSDLDDVDLSLYDTTEGRPTQAGSYMARSADRTPDNQHKPDAEDSTDSAMDTTDVDYVNIASVSSKRAGSSSMKLADDGDDSVTTDDPDLDSASTVETTSVSDAQSCDIASMSDVLEVEANSEFEISWGQLRRARSFSGSISSDNSSSSRSATIRSDSQDSGDDSIIIRDDNSTISLDSVTNKDDNSSTSQDTVVLRQGRIPGSQGTPYTDQDQDDATASEVSSFSEADIDGVFRAPPEALSQASSSGRPGVDVDGGRVEWEGEEQIWWGDNSLVSTLQRPRHSWSSHYDPGDNLSDTTQGNSDSELHTSALVTAVRSDTDLSNDESGNSARDKAPMRPSTCVNGSDGDSLTQPYLEIPRRSRMASHPHTTTATTHPPQSALTAFTTFHPKSTPTFHPKSTSMSNVHDVHKNTHTRHCESDPNVVREKDEQNNESQIDLEFVRSLGDKLLAVSKRSSMPKYQRLETERDVVHGDRAVHDGRAVHGASRQQVKKGSSSSKQSPWSGNVSTTSTDHVTRDFRDTRVANSDVQRALAKRDVLLDDFDLLEEEVV